MFTIPIPEMEVRKVYQKCRRPSSEIQEVFFEIDNNSIVTYSYVSGSEDKINTLVVWRVQSVARLVGGLWRRGHEHMEVLPIVEKTSLGNNCKDYYGMMGLKAALEKGRLVVVKRLLGVREIDKDFTQTDIIGRNALDMMIASPVDYFMTHNLRELASRLV